MPIDQQLLAPWTRKHDNPEFPWVPQAPKIVYPKMLADLIELCKNRPPTERLHAAGSHWALCNAAVSDHTFVETHDPNNGHQALGHTLYDVVPDCMNPQLLATMAMAEVPPWMLVHVEAGKRIYQLYAELDQVDDFSSPMTLGAHLRNHYQNPRYTGPWAFRTLGDSGGQTIVGALTTGTHGGDWREGPVADSVVAIHLVGDGGRHYWIEPQTNPMLMMPLVDDQKLKNLYDVPQYGGPSNFEIIRDDEVFDAVLMSSGRFGIVYSVVLLALPQYQLHEERELVTWQYIKGQINAGNVDLYNRGYSPPSPPWPTAVPVPVFQQEFLQIAVCLTTFDFFRQNLAGVTRRFRVTPLLTDAGRAERVGDMITPFDDRLQAPRFSKAGNSRGYSISPDPNGPDASAPSMLELACSDSSFLRGILKTVSDEIKNFVESNGAVVGASLPLVAAAGGSGLIALAPWLLAVAEILDDILEQFDLDDRLGEQMEHIKDLVLGDEDEPLPRGAAGIFVWQLIAYLVFSNEQKPRKGDAISYAVMETHDYLEQSCRTNVDSIEVFFDATDSRLVAFIDQLIEFEKQQEFVGKAFVGYASLRFVGRSRALLAPERYPVTCAIEVACLKDVSGSQELVDFATRLARSPAFNRIFHWGQRNDCTPQEIERRFGGGPGSSLDRWRRVLSRFTEHGRLDGFSNDFTRATGLEIVDPKIQTFDPGNINIPPGTMVTLSWDCVNNPPWTRVALKLQDPAGNVSTFEDLPLGGQHPLQAVLLGTYIVVLSAKLGNREAASSFAVIVS